MKQVLNFLLQLSSLLLFPCLYRNCLNFLYWHTDFKKILKTSVKEFMSKCVLNRKSVKEILLMFS